MKFDFVEETGRIEAELELLVPRPYRILLVDDQPFIAEVMRLMLAGADDLELHYCGNAAEASQMVVDIHPVVILQDLVMPDVDGLMLIGQYRAIENAKDIPVVVLSAHDEAKIKADSFARGADDYLVKLPDKVELLARLRYHAKAYVKHLEADLLLRELGRLSSLDGLTGLANRRCFDRRLAYEWKRLTREKSSISLLMIDVDHFKAFNDGYGHQAGDDCLQQVASMLNETIHRASDLAARYGGEEFVVMLPNTDLDGGLQVAEIIRRSIAGLEITHASGCISRVTVSIGCASMTPRHLTDANSLVGAADQALYQAKERGRNRVVGQMAVANLLLTG
ncbi:MAG: diguanylate cyclase response regulator [Zetaproteobacteria bacterium CG12_big_fil_rev_8_21_14_0_65_54_13]|nr:MAG: diguanylate cyclase response regulator [Zetaproteobacteria bacterium CG23_combo_of_CG06-09_8_20_14_all_54_7]PIW49840.1 MAG: diguanylate cyclase response regulator [Zetaproteobacteria bacterium CG12_big_fil_rev_8_21_14_0_65_54_13]